MNSGGYSLEYRDIDTYLLAVISYRKDGTSDWVITNIDQSTLVDIITTAVIIAVIIDDITIELS